MNHQCHFSDCPRCGCQGFEYLQSHSFCSQCLYSPPEEAVDTTLAQVVGKITAKKQKRTRRRMSRELALALLGSMLLSGLSACTTARPAPDNSWVSQQHRSDQMHWRYMNRR